MIFDVCAGVSKPTVFAAVGNTQTNEQERLEAARLFVDNLLTKGPLKPGLDRDTAVDVMWTYMATEHFRRLVRDRGWSADRYDHWLADTLCSQLLP